MTVFGSTDGFSERDASRFHVAIRPKLANVMLPRSLHLPTVLSFSMLLLSGCSHDQPPSNGHARMVQQLADIARDVGRSHPILGDGNARKLRTQWERMNSNAPPGAKPVNRISVQLQLGLAELQLGNVAQGIAHIDAVYGLLKRPSLRDVFPPDSMNELLYQLAIAHVRLGETQNCCLRNSPDSCLLPISGGGIHADQRGSRQSIVYLTELLSRVEENSALHLKARWLLNVMYMTIDGYPDQVPDVHLIPPQVFESDEPFPKFENIAGRLGIDAFTLLGGAVVDDFDGDRYFDILVSTYDMNDQPRFYHNNRDGTFVDRTEEANLSGLVGGFNLVHADYDNDGDVDVLMLRGGWMDQLGRIPNSLLQNDGSGRFTDVTFDAGLGAVHYPTQTAAWADYDSDGDLDLYIGNESSNRLQDAPCQLFQNQGDGTFQDVALAAGVQNMGFTKGVVWGDYDCDGLPDLYVSNFGSANRLYRNNGDGTFADVAPDLNVTGPFKSFPVWFWDFDNDGALDLYVSSYEWDRGSLAAVVSSRLGANRDFELAHLYRGDSKGGFDNVAASQNLKHLSLPMGANFGDLDNDGYLDFYLGTGYPAYEALMPNVMYRNQGGTGFSDITSAGGFGHLQKGHGAVFADLDNDGDQDVFEQLGGFLPGDKYYDALFENPGFGNRWIAVKLVGVKSNRSAIGARIHIRTNDGGMDRSIYRHVSTGGSFGANPLRQTIGLGRASKVETLEVFWPTTGETQQFHDLAVDQFIEIIEGIDQTSRLEVMALELGSPSNDPNGPERESPRNADGLD